MIYPNKGVYDGKWAADQRHGKGGMTYPDGGVYDGKWAADQRHGEGKMIYPDGCIYYGSWKNDREVVHITRGYSFYRGNVSYICRGDHGGTEFGVPNGHGTYHWSNVRSSYTGNWVNGQRHGYGKNTCRTGVYKGNYVADKRQGNGVMTYSLGYVYDGQWQDGKKHGIGTLTCPGTDGSNHSGNWVHGYLDEVSYVCEPDSWTYPWPLEDDSSSSEEESDDEESDDRSNLGATEEEISNATEVGRYGEIINPLSCDRCGIRLESFQDGDNVMRIAHCGHMFFEQELTNWLQRKGTCPECRHNIREPQEAPL